MGYQWLSAIPLDSVCVSWTTRIGQLFKSHLRNECFQVGKINGLFRIKYLIISLMKSLKTSLITEIPTPSRSFKIVIKGEISLLISPYRKVFCLASTPIQPKEE